MRSWCLAVALACTPLAAQPAGWEVVSIKPNPSSSNESNLDSAPGGRLTATNITIRELLRLAYTVKDYQIEHAPGWVDTDRYDINGKHASAKKTSLEEEKELIRSLLTGRFHLAARRETRQRPVYLLVVGKDGSKLTPHNDGTGSGTRKSCGQLKATRLTLDTIATVLSRQLDRDVLNQTNLPGKYDFQLDWTPDSGPCSDDAPARPAFVTAIQQQLGLKLEAGKGPADYLIVEHIERPTEN